jgi:hypothetical protein
MRLVLQGNFLPRARSCMLMFPISYLYSLFLIFPSLGPFPSKKPSNLSHPSQILLQKNL